MAAAWIRVAFFGPSERKELRKVMAWASAEFSGMGLGGWGCDSGVAFELGCQWMVSVMV